MLGVYLQLTGVPSRGTPIRLAPRNPGISTGLMHHSGTEDFYNEISIIHYKQQL